MSAFWLTFGAVFLAELGDKSQLLTLTFASRYRASHVLLAVTVAAGVLQGLSVLVGNAVSRALPTDLVQIIAGLAFIGFAVWTLREDHDEDDEGERREAGRLPIVTMLLAFFLAEFGDKTMLTTVTLAATQAWLGTWLGATVGMVTANLIALVVGRQLGERLSRRTVSIAAAVLFFAFGGVLLIQGLAGAGTSAF
ncbi:MAG TPA: TMEM165/GDT1 family protein [Acidimicrobiia bacterium]|nr:TMEM165/GDT1 family protein [Acidimicrobiia bacterium]